MRDFLTRHSLRLYDRLRPRRRFAGLLVALLALLLVPNFVRLIWPGAEAVLSVLIFGALVTRSLLFDTRLGVFGRWSLGLLALGMLLRELAALGDADILTRTLSALQLMVLATVTSEVLGYVLSAAPVDQDKMYAACCGYLLSGYGFATGFQLLSFFEPGGLPLEPWDGPGYVYFSMATLTTLGYGDIAPQLPLARMLAVTEALFGQLYLAVIVARLVGMYTGAKRTT